MVETILLSLLFRLSVNNAAPSNNKTGCGEYFKLECGKDISACFRSHHLHFSRNLLAGLWLVRQAANLWRIKADIQQSA